jgi:thymidylate synthase (methanogen type)
VSGSTIPRTWIEIMHIIYKYGKKNLMNANTDRWVKEVNNLVAVIHDPQNLDLSINPFLVPLTMEKINAYQKEVLSPILPAGKAYTYGNKLRAYTYPAPVELKDLVNSKEFKDFEFKQGPHLDANVKYLDRSCEIDQIQDTIDVLNKDRYSKACVAITWHPADELMRKHKSSPCLAFIQAMVVEEKLNLTVFFRSHDMAQGWPENAYGCAAIQKYIADGIGVDTGIITIISSSAQIYKHYYKQIEDMLKKYRKYESSYADPRGNYLVEVKKGKIVVSHLEPNSGKVIDMWEGASAKELREKVSHSNIISTAHSIYLGEELSKAEIALRNNLPYEQDKDLKIR